MEILGYVGFAALLFLAVTWTIGVRAKLDAGVGVILGALFFVVSAVILVVSGASKLHSLWVVPTGFLLSAFVGLLAIHFPAAFQLFRYLASTFAIIVRAGIPAERIRTAQDAGLRASVEEWASKHHKEK